jgi:methionyl-tRNA synthetase
VADKTFYITTPIYYVNGVPHVGSATTTLLVDALARYHRMRGEPTYFLTGTDEHAQKVADAAAKAGQTPQAFVDRVSQQFVECWGFLDIQYDRFIRTSDDDHKAVVAEVFQRLQAQGDIYPGQYEGWYAVSDETFYRDSEVKDGRAIESGATVERVTEDNYYFRLSAYGDRLLQYIQDNPGFLEPDTRRNEVLAFVKDGLRDVAISRRNTGWGIPVPGDASQGIYVWFDACINYLTATGWPDNANWDKMWPADAHLVGKEIYTRFHATLWPVMLMALGLPLPNHVLGHGWWLVKDPETLELVRGSKTAGNIPTPQDAVSELISRSGASHHAAVDALRYYLIRDISFTGDSEFSYDNWIERYNGFLANKLGNLLNRTLNMLKQYVDGVVPDGAERTAQGPYATLAREAVQDVERAMLALDPGAALQVIERLVKDANEDLDTQAPWKRHKEGDTQAVSDAVYTTLEACRIVGILLEPFMPYTAREIRHQLGLSAVALESWQVETQWGRLPAGTKTLEAQPIFPRIDTKIAKTKPTDTKTKSVKEPKKPVTEPTATTETITTNESPLPTNIEGITNIIAIEDFAKVELKVGEIKSAEPIPKASKLLRLMVDIGGGEERQILAGIAESYTPEELMGRKVVVITNLASRTMRGLESQGMLLAATDEDGLAVLLHPDASKPALAPGAKVR